MNRALKKRTETALDELARTYELVRGLLIQRLEDIDKGTVRKRGSEYAGKMASRLDDIDTKRLQRRGYKDARGLRKKVERRVRPGPPPRWPIAGLVGVGAAPAPVGRRVY